MFELSYALMNEAGDGDGGGAGGEGATLPHWSEGLELPEDVANSGFVRNAPDLGTFAKSALEAHNYAASAIRLPSEHAGADEVAAFRQKLIERVPGMVHVDPSDPETFTGLYRTMGMPEAADGYEVPAVDVGEHGPPAFDEQVAFFREVAHSNGLTNAQFQGVLKQITERTAAARAALAEEKAAHMAALKQEWGNAYNQRVDAARAAAKATQAPEPLMAALESGQVDAGTLHWLASLHDSLSGAGTLDDLKDSGRGNTGEMTPSEAEARLIEIKQNPEHPYWKASDPKHAWAVQEYGRLTAIALGDTAREPHALDQYVEPAASVSFEGRV